MSKKKGKIPKKENEIKKAPSLPIQEQEKPFDFGGLPKRDLKKSLGCG
jgi:hypothetical protein